MFGNKQRGSLQIMAIVWLFSAVCVYAATTSFHKGAVDEWKRKAADAEATITVLQEEKRLLEEYKRLTEEIEAQKKKTLEEAKVKEEEAKKRNDDAKSDRERKIREIENDPTLTSSSPKVLRSSSGPSAVSSSRQEAILRVEYDYLVESTERVNKSAGK